MRPLPEARAPFGPTVRPVESCSTLGVSHPLGGLLHIGVAGLLRPAAGYGVRRVSRCPSHHLVGDGYERSVPRAAVTLRRVPLVSSCAASLRSLPPCRYRPSSRSHPPGRPGLRSTSRTSSLAFFAAWSRLAPFRVDRPSSEEEGREWTPDDRSRRASPRSQRDRSHSGRRPKPSESSRVPAASAEAGAGPPSAEAREGAVRTPFAPPTEVEFAKGSGMRAPRALPPSCDTGRSRYRGVG
jgi:hypothetical protein